MFESVIESVVIKNTLHIKGKGVYAEASLEIKSKGYAQWKGD